jgi:hypothetical protein
MTTLKARPFHLGEIIRETSSRVRRDGELTCQGFAVPRDRIEKLREQRAVEGSVAAVVKGVLKVHCLQP